MIAVLLLACAADNESEPKQVRGLIVNLAAASITRLQSFDLRAEDGQILSFRVDGDVGITPGHAREHMVLGEPVTVTYRGGRDGLLALWVED